MSIESTPVALVAPLSPQINQCELTHLARQPIDYHRACVQHDAYCQALREAGYTLHELPERAHLPDSVFVEDTVIVLDELAVICRPGTASRRAETDAMQQVVTMYRELRHISEPGTIDGGDVLRLGRTLYVGASARSNQDGIRQLSDLLNPFDYRVVAVEMSDCLHLKTAATAVDDETVLLNPAWLQARAFEGANVIEVDPSEPFGANTVIAGEQLFVSAQAPRTAQGLSERGFDIRLLDNDELAKAEGGLSCCSVLIDPPSR